MVGCVFRSAVRAGVCVVCANVCPSAQRVVPAMQCVVPSAEAARSPLQLTHHNTNTTHDTTHDNPKIRVARLWRDPKVKMGILAVVAVTLLLVCLILYFTIYRGPSKTEFDVRQREERR